MTHGKRTIRMQKFASRQALGKTQTGHAAWETNNLDAKNCTDPERAVARGGGAHMHACLNGELRPACGLTLFR